MIELNLKAVESGDELSAIFGVWFQLKTLYCPLHFPKVHYNVWSDHWNDAGQLLRSLDVV